jgi:AcrR family transcriptional regulator
VINERGYQAATFQAIAVAAGLSRPTLHYYFSSREEIYLTLVAEARGVIAESIALAQRFTTLVEQFSALVTAIHATDAADRSQVAFLVSARLESTRNPELRAYAGTALQDFLTTVVEDAKVRGELAEDVSTDPVVDMLYALLWGVSFYAGFVDDAADVALIIDRLDHMVGHGLLAAAQMEPTRCDTDGDTPSVVGGQQ